MYIFKLKYFIVAFLCLLSIDSLFSRAQNSRAFGENYIYFDRELNYLVCENEEGFPVWRHEYFGEMDSAVIGSNFILMATDFYIYGYSLNGCVWKEQVIGEPQDVEAGDDFGYVVYESAVVGYSVDGYLWTYVDLGGFEFEGGMVEGDFGVLISNAKVYGFSFDGHQWIETFDDQFVELALEKDFAILISEENVRGYSVEDGEMWAQNINGEIINYWAVGDKITVQTEIKNYVFDKSGMIASE